ncbi:SseB protein N-terminal domain-containing protein [Micromonospora matsumotoense]|uniref:SseB protein N-terminal domain-containing protein n=1 Tax=Micromonospora matsumotoense TaxID=121616 RepID=A0A1C4W632_9ACTN|nr:SseB family protein [Micromonospora matsumotoense]SCE91696.1 SseB protein N-terminal domain-containing protein [Micromonospora matsumotoense]
MDESWQPANDTERALLRAARADDRPEFFRILTRAELFLPQLRDDDTDDGSQRFVTMDLFGQPFLPVFTSLEAMVPQVAGVADAYTVTGYDELCARWPVAGWRLAINPGTPLDAYLPVEAVRLAADGTLAVPAGAELLTELAEAAADDEIAAAAAAGPADPTAGPADPTAGPADPTAGPADPAAGPADPADGFATALARAAALARTAAPAGEPDTAALLRDAAERGDSTGYLDGLLDALVVLPTTGPVDDPARLVDPDFPWRAVGTGETRVIEVFTSPERLDRAYPDGTPSLRATMISLLMVWPPGHALAVDPDSPAGITLPADQVPFLLLWPAPGETAPGETAPGETAPGETAPGESIPGGTAPGGTTTGRVGSDRTDREADSDRSAGDRWGR